MEILDLVLMSGLAVTIVATVFDAVKAVSSEPIWEQASQAAAFVERRRQNLPYVGVERRKANTARAADTETNPAIDQRRRRAA